MKCVVNGVTVEGTPEEIAAFAKASGSRGLDDRIVRDPPRRIGPRDLTPEEQKEHDRIAKMINDVAARIPNVNITPFAHCTGRRYC